MMHIDSKKGQLLRSGIGTLTEKNLHSSIIHWISKPGDLFEVEVDGYIADIMRDDLIIEVQIKNFSAIKEKLLSLSDTHKLQLIHPIAQQKWIIKEEVDGKRIGRRKSPKKGRVEDLFSELIRVPNILEYPNLSICVLLIDLNEIWKNDGQGSWRRKYWSITDRYLINVHEKFEFHHPKDLLRLLPPTLPAPFTNNDVAAHLGVRKSLAGKMTYCLRKMDEIKVVGKHGQANLMVLQ